jgi:membrane fusion protein, multidrug efflux system
VSGSTFHHWWLAAGAAVSVACSAPPPSKQPPVPVQVAAAVQVAAPVVVTANGMVEPMQTVAVQAQVGGTLQDVTFHEGDEVEAGQVLFRIDPRPYQAAARQAEAALARSDVQADNAKRDAERYKTLAAQDYVTKSQADQAVAAAAAAAATVEADRAAVETARLNLGYTTIKAPISGRTGSLLVRRGNLVRPNAEPLVVINQLRPILVRFPVLQRDFPTLHRKSAEHALEVKVATVDSVAIPETGTLSFLDNAVDSLTGSVVAKARFTNAGNRLWPGEYVRVSVQLDVENGVIAVPSRALQAGQDGAYVFVVDHDQKAQMRPVSTGRVVGDLTVVTSGIAAGERVVVDGQSRLSPGATVDIKGPAEQTASRSGK